MKGFSCLSIILGSLGFMVFFAHPVFASISITTNGDSGDQNVNAPVNANQNNSGITITTNGESDDQNINTPSQSNQNNSGVSITNTVTSNSSNNTNESNSSQPTIIPSSTPAGNHPTSSQSTNEVNNSPTTTLSVSPSHSIKPTTAIIPHSNKSKNPLIFFSKIWRGITNIMGNFFHKPHNI